LDEGHTESVVAGKRLSGLRSTSEASIADPVVEHTKKSDETIRVTGNGHGETTEITEDDDHIDGSATDGEVVLASDGSAAPIASVVSGAFAGRTVVRALLAEAASTVPLAFRIPAAGSGVGTTGLLALVEHAARRREGEIPSAARIFSAEDFVGELDAIVFVTASTVPNTHGIHGAVVRGVPAAEAFAAGPPGVSVVVSTSQVAALGVSSTFGGVAKRADLGTAHGSFRNPLAVVDGVSDTRGFSDVLALATLAASRARVSVPCATDGTQARLGIGEHAGIFLALGTNESGLIPKTDIHGAREALSAVVSVRDVGALVEAARVQRGIPLANPVIVAIVLVGVATNFTDAGVVSARPFARRIGGTSGGVAVLRALIVTALRLSVEDEVVPEVRALDSTRRVNNTVLALVRLVRSVVDDLTAVHVGALTGVATDLDFTVVAEGVTHADERVVTDTRASTLIVDVGPCGRSVLVASNILLGPGFEVIEEGGDDFRRFDGVQVVDAIRRGFAVLSDLVPVSITDVVSCTDGGDEDLTTVVNDSSRAGETGAGHIRPVRVGDEGDDALAGRSDSGEDDEVRAGASESGTNLAGGASATTVGFVPLDGGDEFSAITGQASERSDDGAAELEDSNTNTRRVADVGLSSSSTSEWNLVDPAAEEAEDTDVSVGEAVDESSHVGRGVEVDFDISGRNVSVFPVAALTLSVEAHVVTEAAA
jgi:hypothetical protein